MFKIIGGDGKQYGPVSVDQIRQWLVDGRANSETLAQVDGSADWKPLGQYSEFAATAPPPVAPPFATTGQPRPDVPNHLVPAILCTIFCCMPFGIVAIIFAAQVSSKLQAGDVQGAKETAAKAKAWCWVAVLSWLLLAIPWVFFVMHRATRFHRW